MLLPASWIHCLLELLGAPDKFNEFLEENQHKPQNPTTSSHDKQYWDLRLYGFILEGNL